jgi:hypothetical protein
VGYSTAMDIYVILCFVSVFAALVEFACINFIDTFIKRKAKSKESNPILLKLYFCHGQRGQRGVAPKDG